MNSFNKTEAAVFSCRLCFLGTFPFISLIIYFMYHFHRLFDGRVQEQTVHVNPLLKQQALVQSHRKRYVLAYSQQHLQGPCSQLPKRLLVRSAIDEDKLSWWFKVTWQDNGHDNLVLINNLTNSQIILTFLITDIMRIGVKHHKKSMDGKDSPGTRVLLKSCKYASTCSPKCEIHSVNLEDSKVKD